MESKTKCDFCGEEFTYYSRPWEDIPTTCDNCEAMLIKENLEAQHREWIKGLTLEQRIAKIEKWIIAGEHIHNNDIDIRDIKLR